MLEKRFRLINDVLLQLHPKSFIVQFYRKINF